MDDFTTIYSKAFNQFKNHWKTILGWCAIFAIIPAIYAVYVPMNVDLINFAWFAGIPAPSSITYSTMFVVLLALMIPLSMAHLGLKTARNEDDEPFLTIGSYGFRKPLRSLFFSIIWAIIYIALVFVSIFISFGLASFAIIFLHPIFLYLLFFIGLAFGFMIAVYMAFSAFNAVNNEQTGFNEPIAMARRQLNGWLLHTFVLMLPIFVLFSILIGILMFSLQVPQSNQILETRIAMMALNIQPEEAPKQADDWSGLLKYTTFTKEPPEYEDDIQQYIHELATYKVEYDKFMANKNKGPLPEEVELYLEINDNPPSYAGYRFITLLVLLLLVGVFAYALTVITQLYRTTTGEMDDEMEKEFQKKRMKELSEQLIHDPSSAPQPSDPPDDLDVLEADPVSAEIEEPSPKDPFAYEDPDNRNDTIDPGFDLKF